MTLRIKDENPRVQITSVGAEADAAGTIRVRVGWQFAHAAGEYRAYVRSGATEADCLATARELGDALAEATASDLASAVIDEAMLVMSGAAYPHPDNLRSLMKLYRAMRGTGRPALARARFRVINGGLA